MVMGGELLSFDNDGGIVINNRKYRRRKVKIDVDPKYQSKDKKRKKVAKKNYLNKRKK